jgi:hypothetical protein
MLQRVSHSVLALLAVMFSRGHGASGRLHALQKGTRSQVYHVHVHADLARMTLGVCCYHMND